MRKIRKIRSFLFLFLLGLAGCSGGAGDAKAVPAPDQASRKPQIGIELRRGKNPRELARIGIRGVDLGMEGGTRVRKLFTEPRRAEDAWHFLNTWAPFELKSRQGDLAFHGRGKVKAGPVERRMILEWARKVVVESGEGRGGAAYGIALAWHQGGASGICEDVTVYLTGEVVARACGWDSAIRGQLDPAELAQVYTWFDHWKPFQAVGGDQDLRPGSLQIRLVFAGRGTTAAKPVEQAEIQALGAQLFSELAAGRRGAASAPSAAGTAPGTGTSPAFRLLQPPRSVAPRKQVVLQLPEKPPLPPRPSPPLAVSLDRDVQ
jgi:hypothetical protein